MKILLNRKRVSNLITCLQFNIKHSIGLVFNRQCAFQSLSFFIFNNCILFSYKSRQLPLRTALLTAIPLELLKNDTTAIVYKKKKN